jgi:hypothetical protein
MSPAHPPAGPPVDQARTETYLRLRAEAELRRALALPRCDGPEEDGGSATLRAIGGDDEADQQEPSAEDSLRRLRSVARALVQAGVIGDDAADSVMDELELALAARSRIDPERSGMRDLAHSWHQAQPVRAPAGPYHAVPVGVTVTGGPDSGLAQIQLFSLVIAPDQATLTAAGRLRKRPRSRLRHRHPWLIFPDAEQPAATDDRGNTYQLHQDRSSSDDEGDFSCLLSLLPVPPTGIRWLELTMSPDSAPVRVDLTGHGPGGAGSGPVATASRTERMIDTAGERLLHAAIMEGGLSARWYDLSLTADVVAALDAVGALGAGRAAAGRLAALARRLGTPIPPALIKAAQPATLPAAWEDILENRRRGDGPFGVAAAATVLPELDGTRFVLTGLRSGAAGAELQALAWGWQPVPHFFLFEDEANPWSWSARDDQGRWHIAAEAGGSSDDRHASLDLQLVPALHPDARALEVTLACPSGQVSATVPLDWWE